MKLRNFIETILDPIGQVRLWKSIISKIIVEVKP